MTVKAEAVQNDQARVRQDPTANPDTQISWSATPPFSGRWLRRAVLCACVLPVVVGAKAQVPDRVEYQSALQSAREGQAELLVPQFDAWAAQHPEDPAFTYDALQVQAWAGKHDAVLRQWPALDRPVTPSWVLRAIGFSARSVGQTELALQVYQRAVDRDPEDWAAQAGLILSHTAAKHFDQAHARYEALRPGLRALSPATPLPVYRAALDLADAQQDDFAVLDACSHILQALPDDPLALRARAIALVHLGAATRAQQLPGLGTTQVQRLDLAQRANGRRFQWAQADLDTTGDASRFASMDALLADVSRQFPRDGLMHPVAGADHQQACGAPSAEATLGDVLFGLVESGQSAKAVILHQQIVAAGCSLQPYAIAEAAVAFAAQGQPAQAERLYRAAIADEQAASRPIPQGWWFGLFYALSDQQKHDEALSGLRHLMQDPACGIAPQTGAPAAPVNPDRLSCHILLARLLMYANQLDDAQTEIVPLERSAPADGSLRLTRAALLQARERPIEAHRELAALVTDEPQADNARTALASSAFARHDFAAARSLVATLGGAAPDRTDVLLLRRELANWQHPQVTLSMQADRGNGTGAASGGHGLEADLHVYTAPLTDTLRLFAHSFIGQGNVPAGSVRRTRLGAGVDVRATDLEAQLEVAASPSANGGQGLALSMAYRLSDQWRVAVNLDSASNELPYAAYLNGITGRAGVVRLGYILSESRRFDASLGHTAFSDGNGRSDTGLRWTERWISAPVYQFDTTLGWDMSRNGLTNTPYYNPTSDRTTSIALINQWLTSRTAQRTFTQRLIVDLGAYQQAGQAGAPLEGVRYEHVWSWGPELDYRYGAGLLHRPYDGVSASRLFGYFDLSWYP